MNCHAYCLPRQSILTVAESASVAAMVLCVASEMAQPVDCLVVREGYAMHDAICLPAGGGGP